jgi:MraZ protein
MSGGGSGLLSTTLPSGRRARGAVSFTGVFRHTIDQKGRLIVPSRLRDELDGDRVVLARWAEGCVAMYSGEGWRALEGALLEQSRSDPNVRAVVRAIAASAHQDEIDRQGRITVPEHLRDHAHIGREVVVVGALDHGEMWSPQRWEEEQARVEQVGLDVLVQGLNL